jgi:hypothetical protein
MKCNQFDFQVPFDCVLGIAVVRVVLRGGTGVETSYVEGSSVDGIKLQESFKSDLLQKVVARLVSVISPAFVELFLKSLVDKSICEVESMDDTVF